MVFYFKGFPDAHLNNIDPEDAAVYQNELNPDTNDNTHNGYTLETENDENSSVNSDNNLDNIVHERVEQERIEEEVGRNHDENNLKDVESMQDRMHW